MKYSEYDAHLALSKRAELARQTVACDTDDSDDPIGAFHGMYWVIWFWLVCGAAVSSLGTAFVF